jgi:hypothetical protein
MKMTKPNNSNQIELSPEGAAIAQAVARGAGLAGNQIDPNVRMHDSARGEIASLPPGTNSCAPQPILAIDWVDRILRPTQLDSLSGVRLGMAVGTACFQPWRWVIVVRRDGKKLCEIDYDNEKACEAELETLRMEIDAWLTGGYPFEMFTKANRIVCFDPNTGRPL